MVYNPALRPHFLGIFRELQRGRGLGGGSFFLPFDWIKAVDSALAAFPTRSCLPLCPWNCLLSDTYSHSLDPERISEKAVPVLASPLVSCRAVSHKHYPQGTYGTSLPKRAMWPKPTHSRCTTYICSTNEYVSVYVFTWQDGSRGNKGTFTEHLYPLVLKSGYYYHAIYRWGNWVSEGWSDLLKGLNGETGPSSQCSSHSFCKPKMPLWRWLPL